LAFCVGVLLVGVFANLPSITTTLVFLLLALAVWGLLRWRVSGFLLFGVVYGSLSGHHLLQQQLPLTLEGEEIIVEGVVASLPVERERSQRFEFAIARAFAIGNENSSLTSISNIPATVLLSWYGADSIRVGQQWRLLVKLKRPRGFVNEGGFDYQRWLLSRGIGATGYVRDATGKKSVNQLFDANYFSAATLITLRVERVRESIRLWIDAALSDSKHRSLLLALAIGDNSYIDSEQWRVLQATGTSHLMAISGLHVGLIAMLGFCLGHILRVVIAWFLPQLRCGYFLPSFASVIAATTYSALAGFALPTQRALAMIVVANLAIVSARRFSIWQILTWALLAVVLLDPLAVYESGFWLSFGAVAVLALSFQNRVWVSRRRDDWVDLDAHARQQYSPIGQWLIRQHRKLFLFGKAQWCVFIGLFLPLLALQLAPSMVSPIANAVAIPAISFGVVAPLLAATLLAPWSNSVSVYLLQLADSNVQTVWDYLQWLAQRQAQLPDVLPQLFANTAHSWWVMVLAMIGVGFALAPRGIPGRGLCAIFFLPLAIGIGWHAAARALRVATRTAMAADLAPLEPPPG
jgi:competence protein ComEC